jgi:hypothetical protein
MTQNYDSLIVFLLDFTSPVFPPISASLIKGIIVENSVPGRTRSVLISICMAGIPFGNAVGMLVSGPLAEAKG